MTTGDSAFVRAAMLGGMTGLRSTAGLAAVSHGLADRPELAVGRMQRTLSRPTVMRALTVAAVGEAVADKLPFTPARIEPLPLTGRVLLGALAAAAGARRGESRARAAMLGGSCAAAAAFLAYHVRRSLTRSGTPDPLVAVTEDVTVLEAARQSMHTL